MVVVSSLLGAVLDVISVALGLYVWVLIVSAALSWLLVFGIVNTHNGFVRRLGDILYRLTEPVLRPIRRVVPIIGGLDLSPLVLIFIIMFLQSFIRRLTF